MAEITDLIQLSRFAGERFDLVQSSAGNASLRTDTSLWIKASGVAMSDVLSDLDLCEIALDAPLRFINENIGVDWDDAVPQLDRAAEECLSGANKTRSKRPSN